MEMAKSQNATVDLNTQVAQLRQELTGLEQRFVDLQTNVAGLFTTVQKVENVLKQMGHPVT